MEAFASLGNPGPVGSGTLTSCSREPTMTERLTERKRRLEADLATVNEALKLLAEQPGVAIVFDAISKIRL